MRGQRDPARIDQVLDAIRTEWMANPDARLTQLLFNAVREGLRGTEAPLPQINPRFYNAEESHVLAGLAQLQAMRRRP